MDFLLSDDLKEFSSSLKKFLTDSFPSAALRARLLDENGISHSKTSADEALWDALAETGVLSAALDESVGGLGFGVLAAQAITELFGQSLCPVPAAETICASLVLSLVGSNESKSELLSKVASGALSLSGAFQELAEKDSSRSTEPLNCIAVSDNTGYRLKGILEFVPLADTVQGLLIPAMLGETRALFFVDTASQSDAVIEALPTLDLLRPYFRVTLKDTPAKLVSKKGVTPELWSEACAIVSILATAEMVGAATKAFQMSLEYAKTRVQFGQPIGRFQAISHKLANMHVELEAATSLNRFASHCATNDRSQLVLCAAGAKGLASETLPLLVQEAIQVHGGIGFTFEYDLHLYLRRVRALASLYGSSKSYYRRTAELLMGAHGS